MLNREGGCGICQNQLPRRVLAEDFFDDIASVEGSFDLLEGNRLQAWDIVLGRGLGFGLGFYGGVAIILPSLPVDRQISVMAGTPEVIPCRFPNSLVI